MVDDIFYTMTPSQIRQADTTRSKSLVYGLSGHLGCWGAAYRFSVAYDLATKSKTAIDKRWLRCFQGQVALTPKAIDQLAAAFPGIPVQRMYREGPSGLWQALWGELDEFRDGVLAGDMACFDDMASLGDFNRAVYVFEKAVLRAIAEDDQPFLNVSHLARAVAFRRVLSLFRLEADGMDLIISACLENFFIYAELSGLDVQREVHDQVGLVIKSLKPGTFVERIEALAWNNALHPDECHWLIARHRAIDTRTAWNFRSRKVELSLALT